MKMTSTLTHAHGNTADNPQVARANLVEGTHTFTSLTDTVCGLAERPTTPLAWKIAFAVSVSMTAMFFSLLGYLVSTGVGVWGNNIPVAWAFDIVNFVFWVGIGHA